MALTPMGRRRPEGFSFPSVEPEELQISPQAHHIKKPARSGLFNMARQPPECKYFPRYYYILIDINPHYFAYCHYLFVIYIFLITQNSAI
jgi:hypothetical protein